MCPNRAQLAIADVMFSITEQTYGDVFAECIACAQDLHVDAAALTLPVPSKFVRVNITPERNCRWKNNDGWRVERLKGRRGRTEMRSSGESAREQDVGEERRKKKESCVDDGK